MRVLLCVMLCVLCEGRWSSSTFRTVHYYLNQIKYELVFYICILKHKAQIH